MNIQVNEKIASKWFGWKDTEGAVVVDVKRAKTPLWTPAEKANGFYRKTVQLVFDDGGTAYGCTFEDCLYAAGSPQAVSVSHWSKEHSVRRTRRRMNDGSYMDMTVRELVRLAYDAENTAQTLMDQRDRLQEQVVELKARLRDLQALETALTKIGRHGNSTR